MSLNMLVYRVTEKQDVASPGETGDPFEAFNVSAAKRIATRRQQVKGTVLVLENLDGRRPRLVATKDAHGIMDRHRRNPRRGQLMGQHEPKMACWSATSHCSIWR